MKIAIIIAYFGKLPEYIQLFLDSCKLNYGFEWLIFSDDDTTYNYPSNVHLIKMNFGECKKLIQSKFDFEITLSKPQKLCDYKCAYGVIFEDYIQDYDWWGHCDLDQIFGNLNMFVTEDMLRKYDKLFSLGHLSLYKNSYKNNRIFMGKIEGKIRYKEVFVTERGCGFDEWLPGNVNDIYMQTNSPIMLENIGADINPYKTSFETVSFDINERCYKSNLIRNSIFEVAKGHLFQIYSVNGELHTREFPYVHLQKRKMRDLRKNKNSDNYYLIPNCFIDIGYTKIGGVKVGNNVFVGADTVILPSVTIGNNVIIGAHSTVTHDITDNSVVVGSPAKIICSLDEYLGKEKKRMKNSKCYGEEYTLRKNVSMEMRMKQNEELKGKIGYID